MACNGLKNFGKTGQCLPGYYTGLILFKSPQSIDLESVELKATWEALAQTAPPDNLMYVRFDNMELADNETVTEELIGGRQVVVDEKFGMDKYEILADLCAYQSIYKNNKQGVKIYAFYTTSGGAVMGKLSNDKTKLETIEMYLATTSMKPKVDATAKIVLNVQPQEDWFASAMAVNVDFDFYSLEVYQNILTANMVATAGTSLVFDLYYCGMVENADADMTKFTIKDSTGNAITIDSTSKSGNTYTLNSTALVAGDYTLEYDGSADYMYLEPVSFTVS